MSVWPLVQWIKTYLRKVWPPFEDLVAKYNQKSETRSDRYILRLLPKRYMTLSCAESGAWIFMMSSTAPFDFVLIFSPIPPWSSPSKLASQPLRSEVHLEKKGPSPGDRETEAPVVITLMNFSAFRCSKAFPSPLKYNSFSVQNWEKLAHFKVMRWLCLLF